MAGNSKPRKKFNPHKHRVYNPMMAESHAVAASSLYMHVGSLIDTPTVSVFNELTRKAATFCEAETHMRRVRCMADARDATANAIRTMTTTLQAIADRFARTEGSLAVSEAEATSLRAAAAVLDEAIARIPVNVLRAAEKEVARRFE